MLLRKPYAMTKEDGGTTNEFSPTGWAAYASVPFDGYGQDALIVGANIHVLGGYDGTSLAPHSAYDTSTNTWTNKTRPTSTDGSHQNGMRSAYDAVRNQIYRLGGFDNSEAATCEAYDIATDTWYPLPSTYLSELSGNDALVNPGVIVDGDRFYSFGGLSFDGGAYNPLASAYYLDLVAESWTQISNMPVARAFMGTMLHNGIIYLFHSPALTGDGIVAFNTADGTYSQVGDFPGDRARYGVEKVGNKAWIIGNDNDDATDLPAWVFDLDTHTWSVEGSFTIPPTPRERLAIGFLDNRLYTFCGLDANNNRTTVNEALS